MVSRKLVVLSLLSVVSALTAPITYSVTANTASIIGATGSLDFNFNPGPLRTQAASLQVLGFASDGTLSGGTSRIGNVSGTLPASLTFDNGTGFNDYFQNFKFGSTLTFQVSLFGPALASPDGISTSGSTFAFSMFSDSAGTIPALTSDTTNGFAFLVNVNVDGTTTVTNFSSQTSISPSTAAIPEPSSVGLVVGFITLLMCGLRQQCR